MEITNKKRVANFDHTISVLVKAYLEGTLAKADCTACAVGNICADALGLKVELSGSQWDLDTFHWVDADGVPSTETVKWSSIFVTSNSSIVIQKFIESPADLMDIFDNNSIKTYTEAMTQIESTGYTARELATIEFAFESASNTFERDKDEYLGLMAVVDVLATIHNIDLATTGKAKECFVLV